MDGEGGKKAAAKGAQAAAGCRDCATNTPSPVPSLGKPLESGCREGELLCMHNPPFICAGFIMVIPGAQSGGNNLLILCHFLTGVKIMEH